MKIAENWSELLHSTYQAITGRKLTATSVCEVLRDEGGLDYTINDDVLLRLIDGGVSFTREEKHQLRFTVAELLAYFRAAESTAQCEQKGAICVLVFSGIRLAAIDSDYADFTTIADFLHFAGAWGNQLGGEALIEVARTIVNAYSLSRT